MMSINEAELAKLEREVETLRRYVNMLAHAQGFYFGERDDELTLGKEGQRHPYSMVGKP